MRVSISQSNYLPWKGYFHLIASVDVFVFYDIVQFTKNDWRHRNKVKTAQGPQWLSVPVGQKIDCTIEEVTIKSPQWQKKHNRTLRQNYAKTPHLRDYSDMLDAFYAERTWTNLSALNHFTIRAVADALGIKTRFVNASDFAVHGDRVERLQQLLRALDATTYISAPAARNYLGDDPSAVLGLDTAYFQYPTYPEYAQPHGAFEHAVTALDVLFCLGGKNAREHICI